MSENELQSFLIKVKYQVDQSSLEKLESTTKGVLGGIAKIGLAIGAAALATNKILYDYTKGLSEFYLQAKNLGDSSIQSLKSLGKAAEDVGSSVETMNSSLEGIQKFKRTLGSGVTTDFLRQLAPDIKTGDSATSIMEKLIAAVPRLKKMGMREEQFLQYTNTAGIDYESGYQAWENPEKLLERQKKHSAALGTGEDKTAPTALSAMQEINLSLSKVAGGIAETIGPRMVELIKTEAEVFDKMASMFKDNTGAVNSAMDNIAKTFGKMEEAFVKQGSSLEKIAENTNLFNILITAATGIGTLATLLSNFARAAPAVGAVAGAAESFAEGVITKKTIETLAKNATGKMLSGPAGAVLRTGAPLLAFGTGFITTSKINDLLGNPAGAGGSALYDLLHGDPENLTGNWWERTKGNFTTNTQDARSQVISTLANSGFKRSSIAGLLGNLQKETAGFNPFKIGDGGSAYGIMQWHSDRQRNYERVFGHSMQSVTDEKIARDEQLKFIAWERQNSEKRNWDRFESLSDDPYQMGANISRYYVRPGSTDEARDREARERGLGAISAEKTINYNITNNISGDPVETRRIFDESLRRNQQNDSRSIQQSHQ